MANNKTNDKTAKKKTNIKSMLAISGGGAALSGLLFWVSVASENSNGRAARTVSSSIPTVLVRDTIDVHNIDDFEIVRFGEYNMFEDKITSYYFNDMTETEEERQDVVWLNEHGKYNAVHELRHAMNTRLQSHYDGLVTREFYVADEISAIVAGYLAMVGETPPLKQGKILPHVSYKIDSKYKLSDVADLAFYLALEDMENLPPSYEEMFVGNEELAPYRRKLFPKIKKKTLINEMMTFDINGKQQNLLKLASKNVRNAVYQYIDMYCQR